MSDQSQPTESTDPRLQAALREYLERIDRGEAVNRDEFLTRHIEIAGALRSFFAAEEPLRKGGATRISDEGSAVSTQSIAAQGQETVLPRPRPAGALGTIGSGLAGKFGRYQIIRALGQGAMGAVYLAHDTQLKRQVAIKTPHFEDDPTGELLQRFYREAEAVATLRHANICPIYDVGEIDGKHFISMAYIEGRPLSDLIRGGKTQNERKILIAVHKLAQGLQHAHDHGIVHRDLKPANIMVDKQGEPIIMDFGLARKRRREGEASLTHSGVILGSPAYMSPEQIEGDPESVGPASDQYSLGVVLYEMLTGQLPFRGSVINVLAQIVTNEPTPPSERRPGLDPRIEATCLRMMAKKFSDRFPSMKAVAEQLATIVKSPAPASPDTASIIPDGAPTASGNLAALASLPGNAAASQVRKSLKQKALTATDVTSLEELVRKCLGRNEYEQAIQIIERIPENRRNDALQALLKETREKVDQIALLICEVDGADRLGDRQTALERAEELLRLKPGHQRAQAILEKYSNKGAGTLSRIRTAFPFARLWSENAWSRWSGPALALSAFALLAAIIVISFRGTAVVVEINDPGIEVTVNEATIAIKGPGKEEVKVTPGDQQLKITYAGLETTTRRFSVKHGDKKVVSVSLADAKLVARLDNQPLELDLNKRTVDPNTNGAPLSKNASLTTDQDSQSIEGERLEVSAKSSDYSVNPQDMSTYTSDEWAGGAQLFGRPPIAGEWVDLKLPVAVEGRRHIVVYLTKAHDYGIVQFSLNGNKLGSPIDCFYKDAVINAGAIDLGTVEVARGEATLRVEVVDTNPESALHYLWGLDRVELCKVASLPVTDTRETAEWVFSQGGTVRIVAQGAVHDISTASDLPAAPFQIRRINLGSEKPVERLDLTPLTKSVNLRSLALYNRRITDEDLAPLEKLSDLRELQVYWCNKVTNRGVAHIRGLHNLRGLDLNGTRITADGLVFLKDLKNLVYLNMMVTHIGGPGFAYLKGLPELRVLHLTKSSIGDREIAHLSGLTKLHWLILNGTQVTEAGVQELAAALPECKIQWNGGVIKPKVMAASAAITPENRERRAAQAVLARGGEVTIRVNGAEQRAGGDDALPSEPIQLVKVHLAKRPRITEASLEPLDGLTNLIHLDLNNTYISDGVLAHVRDLKNLRLLWLSNAHITEKGLAYLEGLKELRNLQLAWTSVSAAGLAHLRDLTHLESLDLSGARITDADLANLRNMKELRSLWLAYSPLTDAGLVHLQELARIEELWLPGTRITDVGLSQLRIWPQLRSVRLDDMKFITDAALVNLANSTRLHDLNVAKTGITDDGLNRLTGLTSLNALDLSETKVTAAGVQRLAAALPKCKIKWDGGSIEPKLGAASAAPTPTN